MTATKKMKQPQSLFPWKHKQAEFLAEGEAWKANLTYSPLNRSKEPAVGPTICVSDGKNKATNIQHGPNKHQMQLHCILYYSLSLSLSLSPTHTHWYKHTPAWWHKHWHLRDPTGNYHRTRRANQLNQLAFKSTTIVKDKLIISLKYTTVMHNGKACSFWCI